MNSEITVKQITPDQVNEFFEVFTKTLHTDFPEYTDTIKKYFYTHPNALPKEKIKEKVQGRTEYLLAAFENNKIVGILFASKPFGGVSLCQWLMVLKKHQRKGIGRALFNKWEEIAKKNGVHGLQLEVDIKNTDFYKKLGFKEVGYVEKTNFGTNNYIYYKLIQEPKEENFLK